MAKREENLQLAVSKYIKMQYPKVLFTSDASGVRLNMGQAVAMKAMKSGKGWPDMFIAEPSGDYHGLFIELKKEGEKLYKKDGVTPKTEHLEDQMVMIEKLHLKGYFACFAIGFDQAKTVIDNYLSIIKNHSK